MPHDSAPASSSTYTERLWPSPWVFVSTGLVIPASLLVFLPISPIAGVVSAILLYGVCVAALVAASPRVTVDAAGFRAGRASLPASAIGEAEGFRSAAATQQRGPKLDARAYLVIRGWIAHVITVRVDDESDPTPYWVVSTRRPEALVAALAAARGTSGAEDVA